MLFFRYLAQNFDWLREQLDDIEDDYILFDCPGKSVFYVNRTELFDTQVKCGFH